MTGKSIVVITDFSKEPWSDFITRLENQKTTTFSTDGKKVEIEISTNILSTHLALKFEITGSNKTVVLVRQQDGKETNDSLISKIINEWLKETDQIAICAHRGGGTLSTSYPFKKHNIFPPLVFYHCDQVCEKLKVLFDNITNGDSFDKFWAFIAPKPADVANLLRFEILCPLVALDIDMQALEILAKKKENGEKVKEPKEYLEEMYADNIDYVQKLKELQAKVNTIGEIEEINKEGLEKLAGISNENVDQFFEKLGGKENDPDEFLDHSWGIDGVNSFHDWYCALSSCLRGVEAYKGK